ncbi:HMG box protein [Pleurostoma richardsiae]|uniref:HMG box protein n=1 Tax=Pleurostoma richardsiae TaxID=41990 RepID=A0AA38S7R2_9PEZI|nr:HMG box protein [Pleurostoma richardsiae]
MAQTIPPSPAPSNDEILPTGFSHLVQHNAATSYPCDPLAMDPNSIQVKSQPVSRIGTPAPQMQIHQDYDGLPYQQQGTYPFHGYQHPIYPNEQSQYGPLPDELRPQPYSTPVASPPTPSQWSDVINLRSGSVRKDQGPKSLAARTDRVQKSTTSRKKKERAKAPSKVAKLDKPLSELTKDWTTVPVVDIEAYVNRSVEERRREVQSGKTPGRVKRPMNAFMLYRKAYQTRTKDWCLHNNHQVVSQVCGQSWPLEPDEVREQFNEWARTERLNHQMAHPDYKFTPAKPKAGKRKAESDDEGNASAAEDFDWERGRAISRSRSRARTQTPLSDGGGEYQPNHNAYPYPYAVSAPMPRTMPSFNQSSFQYSNPGKPTPMQYDYRVAEQGQYYQQHVQPTHHARMHIRGGVEDVMIHKTPSPAAGYHSSQQADMLAAHYASPPSQIMEQHGQPLQFNHHVDPLLFPQGGGLMDPSLAPWLAEGGLDGTQGWEMSGPQGQPHPQHSTQGTEGATQQQFGSVPYATLDQTLLQDPLLKGNTDSWQISTLEGDHLDNWADNTPKNEG